MPKTYYPTLEDEADEPERELRVWPILVAATGAALLIGLILSGSQGPPAGTVEAGQGSPHHVADVRYHRAR